MSSIPTRPRGPTFTLVVERGDVGLWHITSPELHGFYVSETSLTEALNTVDCALKELWQVMEEQRIAGTASPSCAKQRESYAPFMASAPQGMPAQEDKYWDRRNPNKPTVIEGGNSSGGSARDAGELPSGCNPDAPASTPPQP